MKSLDLIASEQEEIKSKQIVFFIITAILGVFSVILFVFTETALYKAKNLIPFELTGSISPQIISLIISFVVIIIVWYLIYMRLYSGNKNILFLSFLVLIVVSVLSLNFALHTLNIGPEEKQIPMYSLIFREYKLDDKLVVYSPWENYDWSFYEPSEYKEKFSNKYNERIYIASFYYQNKQMAEEAFDEYRTLVISKGFNASNFNVKVNKAEKFELIDSFAFENKDFIYSEFIVTKEGYLPGYYILVIKSDVNEKEVVKQIVE